VLAVTSQLVLATALALSLTAPPVALADHGGDGGGDVRVSGTCGRGATSNLRLRSKDGDIRVRFEVEHIRFSGSWRVTIVREGRVAYRGRERARRSFEIERRISDYSGADHVSVRAVGPHGLTCAASATLPG
jgi:hypothetical protein